MRKHTLVSSLATRFMFVELALDRMPIFPSDQVQMSLKQCLHGCRRMDPWLLLPWILFFLDTLRPRDTVGSEGVAAVCSGFCARSWVSWRKLHRVSLRTVAFFFPLVTDTLSSFDADWSLSTLDHCSCFNFPVPSVKFSQSKFLICTPRHHGFQLR